MINAGGDYFSSRDFLTGGLLEGIPTVSQLSCGVKHFALLCPALEHFCEVARLTPVTRTAEVKDGVLDLEYTLGASNVLFLEIK